MNPRNSLSWGQSWLPAFNSVCYLNYAKPGEISPWVWEKISNCQAMASNERPSELIWLQACVAEETATRGMQVVCGADFDR